MSETVILAAVWFAQIALAMAMCLCTWRMIAGPRAQDRILSLDALYVCAMLQLLAFGIRMGDIAQPR